MNVYKAVPFGYIVLSKYNVNIFPVIFCLCLHAVTVSATPRNLTLHHRLEYRPKPEYHLTEHPLDPYLLTDGIKEKSLWYEKYRDQTVGWRSAEMVEITLDLDEVKNVGVVNIYTVGGGQSGVEYPEYAAVVTSLDGRHYHFATFAVTDGWDFGGNDAIPRILCLPVEQKARYLKLLVRPTGVSFFSDEIEVMESVNSVLSVPNSPSLSKQSIIDFVEKARQLQREDNRLTAWLKNGNHQRNGLLLEKQDAQKTVTPLTTSLNAEVLAKTEDDLQQLRAKVLQAEVNEPWFCYAVDPIEIERQGEFPEQLSVSPKMTFYQWQNEYGLAAVNLVNTSNDPLTFQVELSPLQFGSESYDPANVFTLRRALYVRVLNAGMVADPLVLQNNKPFTLKAGQVVELCLQAHSQNIKPGLYNAAMTIRTVNETVTKKNEVIPIQLTVVDKRFPDRVPFYTCNWDYIAASGRFTAKNIPAAVQDLNEHHINVCTVLPSVLYQSDYSGQLAVTKLTDELKLRLDRDDLFVLLLLGGSGHLERRFGNFNTSQWQNDFKTFIINLRDYMLLNGYSYDSFAIYPFDESIDEDFVFVANAIRKIDPRLQIYANKWIEPKRLDDVQHLIDIWCPHIPAVLDNQKQFEQYRDMNIFDQIWCYHANIACERFFAPEKTRTSRLWRGDNKTFWRTMPMVAKALGMNGAGFWVYQDKDNDGWSKDHIGNHGVIYDGRNTPDKDCIPELIVPSKRWQMWREGVEDAVCLSGHPELLQEFLNKPNDEITTDFIMQLRKKANSKSSN